jgi:hypothetical protein
MMALVDGLKGWEDLDVAKPDFQLGIQEYWSVERCAFVSDKKRRKWVVKLMVPFTRRTKEKFFEPSQLEEAWVWA